MYEPRTPTNYNQIKISMRFSETLVGEGRPNDADINSLIVLYQAGQHNLYDDIFYHVRKFLVGHLMHFKDYFDEDELAQIGRLAVYEAIQDFEIGRVHFTTWLWWKLRGELSKEMRQKRFPRRCTIKKSTYDPRVELDLIIDINYLLDQLTSEQVCLLLTDESLVSIAESRGVAPQAVHQQRQRIRNKLKSAFLRAGYSDKIDLEV